MSQFDEEKVFIIRLISNEEIIGVVSGEITSSPPSGELKVEVPFIVGLAENGKGGLQINLAPYLYLLDEDSALPLGPGMIAFKYKPNKDVIAKYKSLYLKMTSRLVLPGETKGGLIKP